MHPSAAAVIASRIDSSYAPATVTHCRNCKAAASPLTIIAMIHGHRFGGVLSVF
jgi:hypothetical protein